ncbi:MAG: cupin domain-containing protein [Alphaproteobacteria bacterium]|nr:cupin domain-containing protein [Alphaproteobacteria bacterium]
MTSLRLPALDPGTIEGVSRTGYPEPYRRHVAGRKKGALTERLGLTDFAVNITELAPGAWSALRHWHSAEDEFVMILEGTATLISDGGEQTLGPGMVAGFPKGRADAHHIVNKSDKPVRILEVGSRRPDDDAVVYPEADLAVAPGKKFVRKDGRPI